MGFGFFKKKKRRTSENVLDIEEDVMNMRLDGN